MAMTESEYVNEHGMICPVCLSENIRFSGQPEIMEGMIFAGNECRNEDCGAEWTEQYELMGYQLL